MQYNLFCNAFSQKDLPIRRSYVTPEHSIVECFSERGAVEAQTDEKVSEKSLCVSIEGTSLKLGVGNEQKLAYCRRRKKSELSQSVVPADARQRSAEPGQARRAATANSTEGRTTG